MTYREITGDLLDPAHGFDAIGHGVNLHGVMGAGIAKTIADRWPAILPPYKDACKDRTLRLGQMQPFAADDGLTVLNLASQDRPGPNADLMAVMRSVTAAATFCEDKGLTRLGLPQIGCGIGGLVWDDVKIVLRYAAAAYDIELTVVIYDPNA